MLVDENRGAANGVEDTRVLRHGVDGRMQINELLVRVPVEVVRVHVVDFELATVGGIEEVQVRDAAAGSHHEDDLLGVGVAALEQPVEPLPFNVESVDHG